LSINGARRIRDFGLDECCAFLKRRKLRALVPPSLKRAGSLHQSMLAFIAVPSDRSEHRGERERK
jgi:hypothetical protein